MEGELSESLEEAYPLSKGQSKTGNLPRTNALFKDSEMYISLRKKESWKPERPHKGC